MKSRTLEFIFVNSLLVVLCNKVPINSKKTETLLNRTCSLDENEALPFNRVNTTDRLAALRKLMISRPEKLQALIVTSGDEHQSEFVADYDKRLQYISGFSGSNGNAYITLEKAFLWTDGRYHIQADEQLGCNWLLLKEWEIDSLKEYLPNGAKVGADSRLIPAQMWNLWEKEFEETNINVSLVQTGDNLIDAVWIDHNEPVVKEGYTLGISYTGKTWTEKVNETRKKLKELGADSMVVTALDEIAWLLNIRGYDIPYSCLLKSYLILNQNETILYADPKKIAGNITEFFQNTTITFKDYQAVWNDLPKYSQNQKVLVPSSYGYSSGASNAIFVLVPKENRIIKPSPIIDLKAKKNPTEVLGMEKAHIRDSAALCRFLQYFESRFNAGEEWDELRIVQFVDMFRAQQDSFINISFTTIAAFGPHGALPHFVPTASNSVKILNNSTLVLDSGGQYYDGTTDVTRTIHLGNPTKEQKRAYTRVLMGSIQMSSLIFPNNVATSSIDILARTPLWEIGYDYPHGTGHGVGAALNVHESPINFHYGSTKVHYLKPGYFLSNEPGYYLNNEFGIRLENVMEVIEKPNFKTRRGSPFLAFKDVTLVPYEEKLIDFSLLSKNHIQWLNKYNAQIRNVVGCELKRQNATEAYHWMLEKTKNIPETVSTSLL